MNKLFAYLKRAYRISLNFKKHEELVWKDLKKLHSKEEWRFGVYEKERYIETIFEIAKEVPGTFYYLIYDGSYHCRVKIIENFPSELTTEVFILAAHFNNLLTNGVVVVNVQSQFVEYQTKSQILIHLLYPGEIYNQLLRHYNTSKDVFWAFQKLVLENEAPALIIADLLKIVDNEKTDNE